jgi:HPt (histidine-containing phosphotransfer) domain-containing protein
MLARVGGDETLLRELIDLFRQEFPLMLDQLRTAIELGHAGEVRKLAHAVNGTLQTFSAEQACAAALELEAMGESGDLGKAAAVMSFLEKTIAPVQQELASFEPRG